MNRKVLVVTDDDGMVALVTHALGGEDELTFASGEGQAIEQLQAGHPDLVLIDGGGPTLDGLAVCRRIRSRDARVPILMVLDGPHAAVERAFEVGADDWLIRPISTRMLRARTQPTIPPRPPKLRDQPLREVRTTGGLVLDPWSREVARDGHRVLLAPVEFKILYMLAANEGSMVPYSVLAEYASDGSGDVRLLKTHVSHIRSKLRMESDQQGTIISHPSVGYCLTRSGAARR